MRETQSKKRKAVLLKIIIYTVTVIMLYNFLIIGLTTITDKKDTSILGFRAYIITTESMKPNINPGDIVIIKEVTEEKLNINDVVTVKTENGINTHRIIKIESTPEKRYVIKGDNNNVEDENTVGISQVLGKKILKISFMGQIAKALQDEVYIIIIVIIVLQVFIQYQNKQEKNRIRREKKESEDEKYKKNNS